MKSLTAAARALFEDDNRFSESAQVIQVAPNDAMTMDPNGIFVHEGHVARVVLITEGLGNRRNMNFYSSDAIMTAPAIFEGKSCFLNHPSASEDRDIPERRVQDKCGYFKNCRVESVDGVAACTGELHFDLSEAGRDAFDKARTALHYRQEFPGIDSEYVGLSIHADGDWEDRSVQWQGETLQVKYVTRFTDAVSCDLVTSPARGGRILTLVESIAGANPKKEEGPMKEKLKKLMEAARTALKQADEEKDPAKKSERIAEARKLNDQFLTEAKNSAFAESDPEETPKGDDAPKGDETPAAAKESKAAMCAKDKESKKEDGDMESKESKDDEEADDAAAMKKKKAAAKKKADDAKDDDDDDNVEANRIAVDAILKESGVIVGQKRADRLKTLSLKEAREEIEMLAEDQKVLARSILKQMQVPASIFSKMTEAEKDGAGETNNHMFADCYR